MIYLVAFLYFSGALSTGTLLVYLIPDINPFILFGSCAIWPIIIIGATLWALFH